jgi:hypothetical protein
MKTEFPKQVGWYWFYGYRWKSDKSVRLSCVRVRKVVNGFMYICDGQFMYESEGAEGKFFKAELPDQKLLDEVESKLHTKV